MGDPVYSRMKMPGRKQHDDLLFQRRFSRLLLISD